MADLLKALAPIGGAAAGLGVGIATGNPLAGLLVGQAAGGLLSSGLGLMGGVPGEQGATGAQRQALGLQMHNVEALQRQTGMSAQQVSRLQQLARGQAEQFAQNLNAVAANQSISPVDKEGLLKGLMAQTQRAEQSIQDRIASMEEGSEARRLAALSSATGAVANQAEQIRQADQAAEAREKAALQVQQQAFATDISNLITAVSAVSLMPKTPEPLGEAVSIPMPGQSEMGAASGLTLGDTTLQLEDYLKGTPSEFEIAGFGLVQGEMGEVAQFGKARDFSILAGLDKTNSEFLTSMEKILGGF
jgi:hypothetical protein